MLLCFNYLSLISTYFLQLLQICVFLAKPFTLHKYKHHSQMQMFKNDSENVQCRGCGRLLECHMIHFSFVYFDNSVEACKSCEVFQLVWYIMLLLPSVFSAAALWTPPGRTSTWLIDLHTPNLQPLLYLENTKECVKCNMTFHQESR